MSEMMIVVTEHIPASVAQVIAKSFEQYVPVDASQTLVRCSGDKIPQYIQLMANASIWKKLLIPAGLFVGGFVTQMGVHSADLLWDSLISERQQENDAPIIDAAEAIATSLSELDDDTSVVIGLDYPDSHFGASIRIDKSDPKHIAQMITVLGIHGEAIETAIKCAEQGGVTPCGGVFIKISDDGKITIQMKVLPDLSPVTLEVE